VVEVVVRDNNVDQALRVLKKKMQREGIYREMKMRKHYEKPQIGSQKIGYVRLGSNMFHKEKGGQLVAFFVFVNAARLDLKSQLSWKHENGGPGSSWENINQILIFWLYYVS